MPLLSARLHLALALLVPGALGCSSHSGLPARQGDGGYQISCKSPLADCLKQAERTCRDEGYTVTAASDLHELLGAPTGQSQVPVQKSEATFYCGRLPTSAERPMIELKREHPLESSAPRAEAPAPAPAPSGPPPRACVPGATQACIGPGGCSGGQACDEDGSHFNPCDCGNPPPPRP
jgi:hypothetical protein